MGCHLPAPWAQTLHQSLLRWHKLHFSVTSVFLLLRIPAAGGAADSTPACLLERLQHEPFWDAVPLTRSSQRQQLLSAEGGFDDLSDVGQQVRCEVSAETLLPEGQAGLDLTMGFLQNWPMVSQYLQPLAYLAYSHFSAPGNGTLPRPYWQSPSWRAREGPAHETMTLSDGLNTAWGTLRQAVRHAGTRRHCLRDVDGTCVAAMLVGELLQIARGALAHSQWAASASMAEGVKADPLLQRLESLRRPWPWHALLHAGWGPSLLGALLAIPLAGDLQLAVRDREALTGSACCSWVDTMTALLEADRLQPEESVSSALERAPSRRCCGGFARWLVAGRPSLMLAAASLDIHRPRWGSQQQQPQQQRTLTHTLCQSQDVLQVQVAGGDVVVHIHGASAFVRRDVDGGMWLQLEILHFVSTTDGAVRLTVYGKTAHNLRYYAQALTLPLAHLAQWTCRPSWDKSGPRNSKDSPARLTSFFGYDSVAYCEVPLSSGSSVPEELAVELKALAPSTWSLPPLNLCPVPAGDRRFRLAACTQPLHSFASLDAAAPGLLAEWLDYHAVLGVEHFTVLDADGSLEEPVRRYRERPGSRWKAEVEYVGLWPERFGGPRYRTMSTDKDSDQWRPILFEVEAENYCLWRYRGRAQWAAVLHSPDEFLHVPEAARPGALLRFLEPLQAQMHKISHVEVRQVLFGGPPQDESSIRSRYLFREQGAESSSAVAHTFIANVENVAQAGVHPARPRPPSAGEDPLLIVHADPFADLRVNHYVNALGQDRCGDKLCDTFDGSAAWEVEAEIVLAE
ncbi:unnamed protein product [Polarella glacialis]|uniref:Uncharacterized protein n=1 Tax=Polarella glacialis TaxID=89957 RepID=A0A813JJM9_POLGL|nr:unnamed protein product [Polarella glacialis]CAE8679083.1 unnamed protein product [Polarella glacialis]